MGSLFQAGLEVSVAAPGPVPDLTAGLGRRTGSRFEVREPSSVLVRSPPAFTHGILPLHCNQLQLQPLTPPGRLFCFFIQCLCASVSFLSSLFFFSLSFFFPQWLLLALPPLFHCLLQIVSIIFFIHLSAGCFPPATVGLHNVISFTR